MVLPWLEDSSASLRISSATTAKPLPDSPAWAASIAAFIAKRLVWLAMCWITLEASNRPPDSSAIRWVTVFAPVTVSFPSAVAEARVFITSSVLPRVCVIEAMFPTICSIAEEDSATLAAWFSILLLSCLIVRIISSTVAAVSVTLAAWVRACCFTPSIFALIWCTALAVSVILLASSLPIFVMSIVFLPTVLIDEPIFSIVSLKYSDKSVTSSLPCTGRRTVKSPSPWAISLRAPTTTFIGFIMR